MKCIGICRLTSDPELRTTQGGKTVAKFSVAWNTRWGGEEKAHYLDCTAWGKTAEVLAQHAGKGSQLVIDGRLEQDRWEADDGSKRSKIVVTVENFDFAGKKERT